MSSGNRYLDAYDQGYRVEQLKSDKLIVIDRDTSRTIAVVKDWEEVEKTIQEQKKGAVSEQEAC